MYRILTLVVCVFFTLTTYSQTKIWDIETDIFKVRYSEELQQPLRLSYKVECPNGDAGRSGIQWFGNNDVVTSDIDDYKNNEWDRGHLAPAAAFSCDKETIRKTFSYLNCALQHEGLNRGPWKELERFERNLAKIFDEVLVTVDVVFNDPPERVPGGAAIPSDFIKIIMVNGETYMFSFPNKDVTGTDWNEYRINFDDPSKE